MVNMVTKLLVDIDGNILKTKEMMIMAFFYTNEIVFRGHP